MQKIINEDINEASNIFLNEGNDSKEFDKESAKFHDVFERMILYAYDVDIPRKKAKLDIDIFNNDTPGMVKALVAANKALSDLTDVIRA